MERLIYGCKLGEVVPSCGLGKKSLDRERNATHTEQMNREQFIQWLLDRGLAERRGYGHATAEKIADLLYGERWTVVDSDVWQSRRLDA